jgi:hypothetical protein
VRQREKVKQREMLSEREREMLRERERETNRERIQSPEEQEATSGYGLSTGCWRTDFRRGRDGSAKALQTEQ